MPVELKPGDWVIAFDKIGWIQEGRPEDKEPFWRTATILEIHEPHHNVPETIRIHWHHKGPKNTSHGHHREDLRPALVD
jgi:hypothetical protein